MNFKNIIITTFFIPVPTSLFSSIAKSFFFLNNTQFLENFILILYYPLLIIEKRILSIKGKIQRHMILESSKRKRVFFNSKFPKS